MFLFNFSGTMSADRRAGLWQQKRIFFLTPQVVRNDLHRGSCPSAEICLVVVDEAHRAQGGYAYVEVMLDALEWGAKFVT